MSKFRIVFAGTPEFGLPCLEALAQSPHSLIAIYTQPDRPAGRGRHVQASAVKQWALQHQIPVHQPLHFKNEQDIAELQALKPDLLIVIAYGLILPKAVLAIPSLGCINVHASLLPRWRGASPIQQAILHGDNQTGVSIMQMDVGMDTGPVFCKQECLIEVSDTAGSLHDRLAGLSAKPLLDTINALAVHSIHPLVQSKDGVTYANKITKEDARIDWQEPAQVIARKIRAFHPWPIAYTFVKDTLMRIHQAHWVELDRPQKPGTILGLDKKGLLVATSNQAILIDKIQFPGSKVISVTDWLNSGKSNLQPGSVLK